ncbi:Cell division cycle protein 27-like protein [Camelus dromedarius]|uniref:Cell division cycle protein 27 homolog n=1 Tax=Camelus dromedarius TaxID=9838 RepID=A0A5N4D0Y1_CAMDR|nr:Cell division cycle protein 27-like protein [Camelus dromedarius]
MSKLSGEAAIWQALNHYAYRDAVFLAERLYAEVHSEEALFLLATCYYRSGKAYKAYRLLKGHSCTTPQCKYLLAKCCVDLSNLSNLFACLYSKTDRLAKGSECYQKSLSLNPFLWSPFESLCEIGMFVERQTFFFPFTGEKPDPDQTFKLTSLQNFSNCLPNSCTTLVSNHSLSHRQPETVLTETPQDTISVARIGQTGTKSVFSQSGNSREVTPILVAQTQSSGPQTSTTPQVLSPTITSPPNALPRRSSRLFTSDSSTTKENSKKLKMKFPPKIPNRKTKSKTNKGGITQPNINDSLEITKLDSSIISEGKISTITPQIQAFNLQKAASEGLMSLLREMGKGYLALCSYNCKEAINILSHLPSHHYNTGWVLCQIGRAYFELSEYMQAERIFSEVRRIENYRVEGMEIYSTTLWHLQKDVALSVLSKDLTDMDKNSPEAWCAAGNCFSLQREHDIAIKFFQRAIQVDPNYAYAYTLLGHEFVLTEELDKALACFRNAIRVNPRHYNAWYGLGMIYYKQEKFSLAEMHFQKALDINPQSSVLLCHIGVVQHALKKSEKALDTLNKAIVIDPKNPLCKFHRASVLFANEKYKSALQELEELKQIVPKESLVYFLIGKVYKKLGQTHLALMNFSWAMDLDPKGANNQIKEAIDKRYLPDDEEPITQEEQIMGTDESQESSMTDADDTQLHAAESDEF